VCVCVLTYPLSIYAIANATNNNLIFQDHNNKLAQLRAGKSSKSKLMVAKFKSQSSLNGWEVRQGTYFQDVVTTKYDGGMDANFEFTENGDAVFSGIYT
jgi:Na+-transporting NADH:ubiquinone oxidoreductase subunit NqrB